MKLRLFAASLFATSLAIAVPAVASASSSSIQIAPTAELQARGAYVIASIVITCPAGDTIGFFGMGPILTIQQAVSKTAFAYGQGFGPSGAACTGSPQTFSVPVSAYQSNPPYRIGPAEATLSGGFCDPTFTCTSLTAGPVTIRIVH